MNLLDLETSSPKYLTSSGSQAAPGKFFGSRPLTSREANCDPSIHVCVCVCVCVLFQHSQSDCECLWRSWTPVVSSAVPNFLCTMLEYRGVECGFPGPLLGAFVLFSLDVILADEWSFRCPQAQSRCDVV